MTHTALTSRQLEILRMIAAKEDLRGVHPKSIRAIIDKGYLERKGVVQRGKRQYTTYELTGLARAALGKVTP